MDDRTVYVLTEVPSSSVASGISSALAFINITVLRRVTVTPSARVVVSVGVVEEEALGFVSTVLYAVGTERSVLLTSVYSPVDVEFSVYFKKLSAIDIPNVLSIDDVDKYFECVGSVRNGISMVEVGVNLLNDSKEPVKPSLLVLLPSRVWNSTLYAVMNDYVEVVEAGQSEKVISQALAGSVGVSLLETFFPVVVLYLVYVYVAKPRAQGALEFVLARPITRLELYVTRYFAGVLVVLAATAFCCIALTTSIYFIAETSLDPCSVALLYAGLSLVAFYSLCYLFSALTSSTKYIVVSVMAYIVFALLWGLLVYLAVVLPKGFGLGLAEELVKAQYTRTTSHRWGPSTS